MKTYAICSKCGFKLFIPKEYTESIIICPACKEDVRVEKNSEKSRLLPAITCSLIIGVMIGFISGKIYYEKKQEKFMSDINAANNKINGLEYQLTNIKDSVKDAKKLTDYYKKQIGLAKNSAKSAEKKLASITQKQKVRSDNNTANTSPGGSQLEIMEYEKLISDMLRGGIINSVNVEYNQVRINPDIWDSYNLELKQNALIFFSKYFDAKGSTGRVTILNSRNDEKFATYGAWGGLKIIR